MIAKINIDGEDHIAVVFEPIPATSFDDVSDLRESLLSLLSMTPQDAIITEDFSRVLNFVSELNGTSDQAFAMFKGYFDAGKNNVKATVKDCKITF